MSGVIVIRPWPLSVGERCWNSTLISRAPGRHVDMEGVDVARIAPPLDRPAAGADPDAGERRDRPARPVIAGQPLRVKQGQRPAAGDGDRLDDAVDAAAGVACVDLEPQRAGIGDVARHRHRGGDRHRLRHRGADLRERRDGDR